MHFASMHSDCFRTESGTLENAVGSRDCWLEARACV
jgi:hypothetical protein